MTEMYDVEILSTLQKAVTQAVAASAMPTLPVKYVGRSWAPPADQKWLELVMIPNNRTTDHWGNEKNYQGVFRLILHWRNDDAGAYGPMRVLASVASWFSKATLLSGVQISANPDLTGAPLSEGAETLYPATLRYRCFRP